MFYRQHATQFVGAQQSTRTRRRHSAVRGLRPEVPLNGSVLISEELREMSDILRTRARQHPGARRAANHLEARISHHDARKSMPSARLARLPVLLRELVSLRYHRYSHGNLSAVRDLVKKPDNIGSGRGLA
jgi:hypothetical protein